MSTKRTGITSIHYNLQNKKYTIRILATIKEWLDFIQSTEIQKYQESIANKDTIQLTKQQIYNQYFVDHIRKNGFYTIYNSTEIPREQGKQANLQAAFSRCRLCVWGSLCCIKAVSPSLKGIFWFQKSISKVVFFWIQNNLWPHESSHSKYWLTGSFLNSEKCSWTYTRS